MEVCDVCGAFLIVGDAQQRIDDHLMGKQHVGYARLKMAMEQLIVSLIFFPSLKFTIVRYLQTIQNEAKPSSTNELY
jgi:hypothetical protein